MSDIFTRIDETSRKEGLSYLLIGGPAVNASGYHRTTLDVDWAIPDEDLPKWRVFMEAWGYQWQSTTEAFIHFAPPSDPVEAFPVDFMLLSPATFEKMFRGKKYLPFGSQSVPVPEPLHLIALKLHALNNPARERKGKALPDILNLIEICQIDPPGPSFQEILSKYAPKKHPGRIPPPLPLKQVRSWIWFFHRVIGTCLPQLQRGSR